MQGVWSKHYHMKWLSLHTHILGETRMTGHPEDMLRGCCRSQCHHICVWDRCPEVSNLIILFSEDRVFTARFTGPETKSQVISNLEIYLAKTTLDISLVSSSKEAQDMAHHFTKTKCLIFLANQRLQTKTLHSIFYSRSCRYTWTFTILSLSVKTDPNQERFNLVAQSDT